MTTYTLTFFHNHQTVTLDEGTLLSDACALAGYPLDLVCGGKGTCNGCQVTIETKGEKQTVQACMTAIHNDLTVYLNLDQQMKAHAQILDTQGAHSFFQPAIQKRYLDRASLIPDSYTSVLEGIQRSFGGDFDYPAIKKASHILLDDSLPGLTLVIKDHQVLDVQPGDTSNRLYGGAIDIGTTSVVLYVYDLNTGESVGIYSGLNQQMSHGADVISRIQFCRQNPMGTAILQEQIMNTLNQLIEEASSVTPDLPENLYQLVLCGNSTMQHLFLGFNPSRLGQSPFISTTRQLVTEIADAFDLRLNPQCQVSFLPLLGGFVGGDTTAALLSVPSDGNKRLVIDLGTNGEIAVGTHNGYLVASTACGPALEGAGLVFGMRGTSGAIEGFELIDGQAHYKVIGSEPPKGICGSGIIDILANLLRHGLLDKTGKFVVPDPDKNPSLSQLFVPFEGKLAFQVVCPEESAYGEGIYVTQKDIRQIQLAKSAVKTGCLMLLEKYGLTGEALDEIHLAGAFGNYINVTNAQLVGLIPHFNNVPTLSVGNAAGTGVQTYLLNLASVKKCQEILNHTTHVELASDPNFQTLYLENMYFGGVL